MRRLLKIRAALCVGANTGGWRPSPCGTRLQGLSLASLWELTFQQRFLAPYFLFSLCLTLCKEHVARRDHLRPPCGLRFWHLPGRWCLCDELPAWPPRSWVSSELPQQTCLYFTGCHGGSLGKLLLLGATPLGENCKLVWFPLAFALCGFADSVLYPVAGITCHCEDDHMLSLMGLPIQSLNPRDGLGDPQYILYLALLYFRFL